MKKTGILHPELSHMVASCGHTDYIVLADKGYPVPNGVNRINLGFMDDHPTILQVLEALSSEMKIDRLILTDEMVDMSPERVEDLKKMFPQVRIDRVSHTELKELTDTAFGVVKTADTCPYANLMVVSG